MSSNLRRLVVAALVLVVAYVAFSVPSLYGEYLWFVSLGYESVFTRVIAYKIGLFGVASIVTFVSVYTGYRIGVRNIRDAKEDYDPSVVPVAGALAVSVFVGLVYSGSWETVLRFLNPTEFGVTDPLYSKDVSFYVFDLPFYGLIVGYLVFVSVVSLVFSLVHYAFHFGFEEGETVRVQTQDVGAEFDVNEYTKALKKNTAGHLSVYIGLILVALGLGFYLDRFELVFSTRGVVFGAGATDIAVFKPLLLGLAGFSVLGGVVSILNPYVGTDSKAVYVAVGVVLLTAVGGNIVGSIHQSYIVEPDEFNKQNEYIQNEIEFTRQGFALDRVKESQLNLSNQLTRDDIENNPGTVDNIRLWDYRPLLTTYNEIQVFRSYYGFNDVDIDRYDVNGSQKQVMVSAREIQTESLSGGSGSWVNRHMVYTHGYGVAMSPVSKMSSEGLPEFYVKDIPPQSSVGIDVEQPRIYYGESTDTYALVNSGTEEFDYPSGDENVYTSYSGNGGVELSSSLRKLIYSAKFGTPNIFVSDSVTDETRIQYDRDIQSRVKKPAPFLEYDSDPYVVVADGELYWVYDAYTTTENYPYSKRLDFKGDEENYVRNSVKVVVDAYSGETNYYVSDEDDPIIQTYEKVFPSLFEEMDQMPKSISDNVRYPTDAFDVQSRAYLDYHMQNPRVFYNKEDSWRIPNEVSRGDRQPMEPYYVMMKLPGEEDPEFVEILPFVPRGKENMIGWLSARSDQPNYGDLRAIQFSKQNLTYGPMQIESRIDQNTEISQRITLWSQAGSSVIRGNLLAIPIDDSMIYVEPLYLESSQDGALPELKRVILAHENRLTMQPNLNASLDVVFGTRRTEGEGITRVPATDGLPPEEIQRLRQIYDEAQTALRDGDFTTYAQRIEELGRRLEEAEARAETEPNTTVSPSLNSTVTEPGG
ncbi:UPF0182 family protein [Halorutilales archaeon Cl-col2-1]